ncbi:uncharacterized protein LOC34622364 [Cyclospora cayetanensis]|uniref:Uncharacterized protein n=2 Tax=Cyclospora cayetanensis TaxID=88456 RepID=A0A1D3D1F1_9EIME|nr:uncharacterized protein LOC34622364 [Cyclospora cayetanensis]OEH77276.1 hypothetical protein cyc_06126 [Cyclospora cayetanensis]
MKWLEDAKRDLFRRGSPAFRVGVWVAGLGGALVWIYFEERNKPINERILFLPSKREVAMDKAEIEAWNQRLSGSKLLPVEGGEGHQKQQEQGVEAARSKVLADIKRQPEAGKKEQHQGWISSVLGMNYNASTEHAKHKKLPLLFDK